MPAPLRVFSGSLATETNTFAPMPTDALLDLRAVAPARLAQDWLLPALERGGEQHWTFADGPGIALRPGQRWRFWRRPLAKLPA